MFECERTEYENIMMTNDDQLFLNCHFEPKIGKHSQVYPTYNPSIDSYILVTLALPWLISDGQIIQDIPSMQTGADAYCFFNGDLWFGNIQHIKFHHHDTIMITDSKGQRHNFRKAAIKEVQIELWGAKKFEPEDPKWFPIITRFGKAYEEQVKGE